MGWNGSGTFTRTNGDNTGSTTWQQDKADGDKILSSRHDTHDQDLADGISACLAKNGENAMTGNLNLNSNQLQNVGTITGNATFSDSVDVLGNFTAAGSATLSGGLSVPVGDVLINNTLTGGSSTILTGTLSVGSTSSFTGEVTANAGINMSNTDIENLQAVNSVSGGTTQFGGAIDMGGNLLNGVSTITGSGITITFNTDLAVPDISISGALIKASSPPSTATDTGVIGQIEWDSSYIYVCVSANTWKRVAIATW